MVAERKGLLQEHENCLPDEALSILASSESVAPLLGIFRKYTQGKELTYTSMRDVWGTVAVSGEFEWGGSKFLAVVQAEYGRLGGINIYPVDGVEDAKALKWMQHRSKPGMSRFFSAYAVDTFDDSIKLEVLTYVSRIRGDRIFNMTFFEMGDKRLSLIFELSKVINEWMVAYNEGKGLTT